MHAKMSAAVPRTGMAGVAVTVVDQLDCSAWQGCGELRADPLQAAGARSAGGGVHWLSVGIFEASQKPCPSANSKVSPIVPYILKFTQTVSSKLYAT